MVYQIVLSNLQENGGGAGCEIGSEVSAIRFATGFCAVFGSDELRRELLVVGR
jgi:hypothetical protein